MTQTPYSLSSFNRRLTSPYGRSNPERKDEWEVPEHIRLGALSMPLEPIAFWAFDPEDES
jgi:hypothetical protein